MNPILFGILFEIEQFIDMYLTKIALTNTVNKELNFLYSHDWFPYLKYLMVIPITLAFIYYIKKCPKESNIGMSIILFMYLLILLNNSIYVLQMFQH